VTTTDPTQHPTGTDPAEAPRSRSNADVHTGINWTLLERLKTKPHRLLNIADDFERQIRETPLAWTGEVFQEARTAHHLLDLVGIPAKPGYASDLDARTYLAVRRIQEAEGRLARILTWHSRETGPAGIRVGDFCNECGQAWPCDTRRMASGRYVDPDDQAVATEEASTE
jgi:hypothetical protein